jgi:hypothetical protein
MNYDQLADAAFYKGRLRMEDAFDKSIVGIVFQGFVEFRKANPHLSRFQEFQRCINDVDSQWYCLHGESCELDVSFLWLEDQAMLPVGTSLAVLEGEVSAALAEGTVRLGAMHHLKPRDYQVPLVGNAKAFLIRKGPAAITAAVPLRSPEPVPAAIPVRRAEPVPATVTTAVPVRRAEPVPAPITAAVARRRAEPVRLADPFAFFEQVYCVNLPEAADRWQAVSNEFARFGLQGRVQRCFAQRPAREIFSPQADAHHNYPAVGMVGCTLSHLKVLIDALDRGFERILIFEDDVKLADDAPQRLSVALAQLPESWDIFYLGGEPIAPLARASPSLVKTGRFWGSYAYALQRKCFVRLMNSALDNLSNTSWDGHLSIFTRGLEKYCICPPICKTFAGYSYVMDKVVDWNPDSDAHWAQFAPPMNQTG